MKIGKNTLGGNSLDFALNNFAIPSLRFFQPCSLNRLVRWSVKFRDQGPDQVSLIFSTERSNLSFDLCYSCGHGHLRTNPTAKVIVARAFVDR